MRWPSFFAALLAALLALPAAAESLDIGLSRDAIAITSNFDGTQVTVFGTVAEPEAAALAADAPGKGYDIVVTLTGPPQNVTVRRKRRVAGIWANGASQLYVSVPAFYATASTRPLEALTAPEQLALLQIGPENLDFPPRGLILPEEERRAFTAALVRLRRTGDLFARVDGSVAMLSPTLFRATFHLPANVPVGTHAAQAFLFKDGNYLNSTSRSLLIEKEGFERFAYALAYDYGLLYGLVAVLIAIATGWLASVAFRRD